MTVEFNEYFSNVESSITNAETGTSINLRHDSRESIEPLELTCILSRLA